MTGWLIRAAATVAGLYALDSLLYLAAYDGEVASAVIGDVWLKLALPTLVLVVAAAPLARWPVAYRGALLVLLPAVAVQAVFGPWIVALVQLFTQLVLVVALPSPPGRAEFAGA